MLTKHARVRAQQRSIPPLISDWLIAFGAVTHDHRGAEILYFDKRARRSLEREVGRPIVRRLSDYLDCYAVVDDGDVTTGWQTKRLRRP